MVELIRDGLPEKTTWFFDTFGIVTPFLSSRASVRTDDLVEGGLPAATFVQAVEKNLDEKKEILRRFSDETLLNIAGTEDRNYQEEELITKGLEIIDQEERGRHPEARQLSNLVSGILFNHNWEYLSKEDLEKWVAGYTHYDLGIEYVIKTQNGIFDLLVSLDAGGNMPGWNFFHSLIQEEYSTVSHYDPKNIERRDGNVMYGRDVVRRGYMARPEKLAEAKGIIIPQTYTDLKKMTVSDLRALGKYHNFPLVSIQTKKEELIDHLAEQLGIPLPRASMARRESPRTSSARTPRQRLQPPQGLITSRPVPRVSPRIPIFQAQRQAEPEPVESGKVTRSELESMRKDDLRTFALSLNTPQRVLTKWNKAELVDFILKYV